jgi:hypothetical protein
VEVVDLGVEALFAEIIVRAVEAFVPVAVEWCGVAIVAFDANVLGHSEPSSHVHLHSEHI